MYASRSWARAATSAPPFARAFRLLWRAAARGVFPDLWLRVLSELNARARPQEVVGSTAMDAGVRLSVRSSGRRALRSGRPELPKEALHIGGSQWSEVAEATAKFLSPAPTEFSGISTGTAGSARSNECFVRMHF